MWRIIVRCAAWLTAGILTVHMTYQFPVTNAPPIEHSKEPIMNSAEDQSPKSDSHLHTTGLPHNLMIQEPIPILYFSELSGPRQSKLSAESLNMADCWLPRCQNITISNTTYTDSVPIKTWKNERDFNLVYIKIEKVGGTTVSGVVRQIAAKYGLIGVLSSVWIQREPGTFMHCIWHLLGGHEPETRSKTFSNFHA